VGVRLNRIGTPWTIIWAASRDLWHTKRHVEAGEFKNPDRETVVIARTTFLLSVRIPTEPATYSDLNPAALIDAAPVGLWARRPSSIATLNHNGSALSTSPQAGRELQC